MEKLNLIPGDLVKVNGVVNVIDGISPKSFSKDMVIEAHAIEGNNTNRYRYDLDFGRTVSVEPIKLTPSILESNGWKRDGGQYIFSFTSYTGDKVELIGFFIEMFKDVHDILKYRYFQITNENKVVCGCFYCHQLQHLLFGLGLNSNLKV